MRRNLGGFLLAAGMLFAATGCNLVFNRGAAGDLTVEALAQTALQQTAAVKTQSAALKSKDAPLPTGTVTLQPTPTFTPTITLTPTLEKVTVTVSKNTNCRQGPDKFFDLVGIMKVGETAEAIGRNAAKTYWVIRLPANTAKTCWLWYEWATVTGNGDALPIVESPPTPTWSPKPDFTFYHISVIPCGSSKFILLQVTNTGNVPWESVRVSSKDLVSSMTSSIFNNSFIDLTGCGVGSNIPTLYPGDTAKTYGATPPASSGHNTEVTLHLYTDNNGGGTHMSGSYNITLP
jgi:hypothetical protein